MSCNIGGFLKGQVSSCKSGTSLNVPELEADKQLTDDGQTYAKEQLRVKPNGQSYSGSLGIRCLVKFISPQKTKKKKKKEEKRREYFLQTFRLYSYSYLPRLFCTEYFVTIREVPTTFSKSLNFEQNYIRQLFF